MIRYFTILILLFFTLASPCQKMMQVDTPTQKGQLLKKKKIKVGVWLFYEDGRLVLEYDYDINRVIFQRSTDHIFTGKVITGTLSLN